MVLIQNQCILIAASKRTTNVKIVESIITHNLNDKNPLVRQQVQEPLKTTRPPGYCWFSLTTTPRWNFREMSPDTLWQLEINTKIQDGGEAPDMVTLTFILWEITSKLFLLAWGLWLLQCNKTIFKNRGRGILVNSAIFRFFCSF